jgi:ABC-type amino acid transport substrate-binding protein
MSFLTPDIFALMLRGVGFTLLLTAVTTLFSLLLGIGVPINDSLWRDQVNYALQELWKNGRYAEIYARWFEGPDRILDLPLAGEMEVWPE